VSNATFSNISAISWQPVLVERTTDHGQATGKLYHLRLWVERTFFVFFKCLNLAQDQILLTLIESIKVGYISFTLSIN
jgi:hypothetical protein